METLLASWEVHRAGLDSQALAMPLRVVLVLVRPLHPSGDMSNPQYLLCKARRHRELDSLMFLKKWGMSSPKTAASLVPVFLPSRLGVPLPGMCRQQDPWRKVSPLSWFHSACKASSADLESVIFWNTVPWTAFTE